jgi:sugar phosphate permease
MGIAFSGVGVGSIVLLPLLQIVIEREGWRVACGALGVGVLLLLAPINLILRKQPKDVGLEPDGMSTTDQAEAGKATIRIVDRDWAAIEWTLGRAARTKRFWSIALGYFCGLFAWYAVQVHQTKYLVEIGFTSMQAAWALGLVSLVAIPGQIMLGHVSDRIGREWVWTIGCAGFAICYFALMGLRIQPSASLLCLMVVAQGTLGYSLTSVIGPVAAEIFEGPHFGSIFGVLMLAAIAGGAAGPWVTGALHDLTGSYTLAFWLAAIACAASAAAIWIAGPRKVRLVPGRSASA